MALIKTSLAIAALAIIGCGSDSDSQDIDASTIDAAGDVDAPIDAMPLGPCAADLGTVADQSQATETDSNVVISEVDPGEFIELYNAGDAAVMLSATGYFWCNNRSYPSFGSLNIEIAPGGRRTISWPGGNGGDAGGDVSIYSQPQFNGGAANILDYVCWGDPASGGANRLADATGIGKWAGNCAPALTPGASLVRLPGQDGTDAADYMELATPDPENCE